jgi:uncharacterized protein (DUF885 family)
MSKNPLVSLVFGCMLLVTACGGPVDQETVQQDMVVTESDRINAWFDERNEERLMFSPLELTALGRKDLYDRIDDLSEAGEQRFLDWWAGTVTEMQSQFDYDSLDLEAKTSWDLWIWNYENRAANARFIRQQYIFNQMNGEHTGLPTQLISFHTVDTAEEMRAYNARVRELGRAVRQLLDITKANAAAMVRPPRFAYEAVIAESGELISGYPFDPDATEEAPLYADGKAKIDALFERNLVDEAQAEILLQSLEASLLEGFQPAYTDLITWFESDIRNTERDARGVWALPDGEAYYQRMLESFTTTSMTADEVYNTGLREVNRLRTEMQRIAESLGFNGDLAAFSEFMRTDEQFYYPDTDEGRQAYLAECERFLAFITDRLPDYFGLMPKAPLVVRRVEAYREQPGAAQHYYPGSVDGSRPGIYYVHLSDMRALPTTDMEPVTYHEGLPGHHMQLSIAQELTGIPEFRKQLWQNAYAEGWALYAEELAYEMGAYKDPYSNFGRLVSEMWRAIRLVVDTGMHSKRWTEQQAIDYFSANSSIPLATIQSEIRRYLVWPGQAASYKAGMLKILALRQRAMDTLGEDFDIREFHDVILGGGSMPLEILGKRVDNWLASKGA